MTAAETTYEPVVLGPDDMLVLVTRAPISVESLLRIREQVPTIAGDRVLVVDGETFAAHIIRGGGS